MNSRYLTDKAKYLVFFVAYTHTLLYMYYFMATANGLRIFRGIFFQIFIPIGIGFETIFAPA